LNLQQIDAPRVLLEYNLDMHPKIQKALPVIFYRAGFSQSARYQMQIISFDMQVRLPPSHQE
jgi:hypothetical protein